MNYFFYIFTGLTLILLQSLVLGVYLPAALAYDLQIPLVVYLSLYHPNGKTLLLIVFMGLIMDGITGGAMGIYMLVYFWLFVGVQLAVHYFQKDSFVLMAVMILLGIFLEYGLYVLVAGLSGNALPVEADMTEVFIGRLIAAAATGPVLVSALKWMCGGAPPGPDMAPVDLPGAPESRTQNRSQSAAGVSQSRGSSRSNAREG